MIKYIALGLSSAACSTKLIKNKIILDTIGDLKLPGKLSVELKPRDMDTWSLVQSLSMNPRVRATVELQKPLSLLLAFLENRWQTENRKLVSFLA